MRHARSWAALNCWGPRPGLNEGDSCAAAPHQRHTPLAFWADVLGCRSPPPHNKSIQVFCLLLSPRVKGSTFVLCSKKLTIVNFLLDPNSVHIPDDYTYPAFGLIETLSERQMSDWKRGCGLQAGFCALCVCPSKLCPRWYYWNKANDIT